MRKIFFGWVMIALLVSGLFSGDVSASTNDFVIKDFQADYYLDIDNKGRSTLKTVEVITAVFPSFDQNHGIERALVATYDGHSANLDIQSVQDQDGIDIGYSTSWDQDNLVLRIGDAETYVHGEKTYVINYLQNDVTRYYQDTDSDEFYWDVNGTGWYQHFDNVTARLHLGQGIAGKITSKSSCYYGAVNSNTKCTISFADDIFTANVTNLAAGENMTIAVGFATDTFTEYKPTVGGFIQRHLVTISAILGIVGLIILLVLKMTKGKSHPGRGTIVAEYLPPRGVDIILSSIIKNKITTWVSAMTIDLAVRYNIRIIETDPKKFAIEYINSNKLNDNELEFIKAFFGENATKGDRYAIEKNKPNTKLSFKLSSLMRSVNKQARKDGYYLNVRNLRIVMTIIIIIFTLQSFVLWAFSRVGITIAAEFLPVIGIITAVFGIWIIIATHPLSAKGRELLDYLKGLKLYINTAEKNRLKILQSPSGAEKTPIDTDDNDLMLHLYERVLPYAVLFGSEKEWTKTLGKYYEQQETSPDWYVGHSAFNAVIFSSMMSDFSSGVRSNSYMASSSSSSGGSSGGGFSGGGGGGGGW